ncbi:hypothetical protein WJX81_007080 [Elliptochloris bilobata]|uniref:Uncharacterized protein n=1 Tax=Elliptochloris bilobata TaxID=381761 RepID=A0AAW1RXM1_9CHLO
MRCAIAGARPGPAPEWTLPLLPPVADLELGSPRDLRLSGDRFPTGAASVATSTAGPPSTASGSEMRLHKRPPLAPAAEWPRTLADMEPIVAANTPLFFFHPSERYFPCMVEWFLARCEVVEVRRGWRRRVLRVLERAGSLTGATLQASQQRFSEEQAARRAAVEARRAAARRRRRRRWHPQSFLLLRLVGEQHRRGQPELLDQVPVYAHVKEVLGKSGRREALEINYMHFLAFNGSYKLFGWLYVGELGAHDADWEHTTVRLTADGRHVLGMYYSAHRHRDGVWRSADEVPQGPGGRPLAFVAVNGHGAYPVAGTIPRIFYAANDQTSDEGLRWSPSRCMLVSDGFSGDPGPAAAASGNGGGAGGVARVADAKQGDGGELRSSGSGDVGACGLQAAACWDSNGAGGGFGAGRLPQVESRGSSLNGSSYPSPHLGGGDCAARGGARVRVERAAPGWLAYAGRWGSTVEAPAQQEWFRRAENPVSRTWLQTVVLPLWPGVESITEPAREEVEDVLDALDENVGGVLEDAEERMGALRERFSGRQH